MEVGAAIGNGPSVAPAQEAALGPAGGTPPGTPLRSAPLGTTSLSAPSLGGAPIGVSGGALHGGAVLTVEAVLWPTSSAAEAGNASFACVVSADGVELGRAASFPLGPLSLPLGKLDSRLTLRFVSSRPTEAGCEPYEGEVVVPLAKLLRPGTPRNSSLWLGLPPRGGGAASLDLQQAMLNSQNPEVPKVCLSASRQVKGSSKDLPTIPEGPRLPEADGAPTSPGGDATPGPACGNGHWARSSAPMLWRYEPGDGIAIKVRSGPEIDASWTGNAMLPGEVFQVSQEQVSPSGIRFLRLADGRGWLFDQKPGVGTMCVRHGEQDASSTGPSALPRVETPPPTLTARAQPSPQRDATSPGGPNSPARTSPLGSPSQRVPSMPSSPQRTGSVPSSPQRPFHGPLLERLRGARCSPIAEGQLEEEGSTPSPSAPLRPTEEGSTPSPNAPLRPTEEGSTPSPNAQLQLAEERSTPSPNAPLWRAEDWRAPSPITRTRPKEEPAPSLNMRVRPKALCDTDWIRSGRSVSPTGRARTESPPPGLERKVDGMRSQALCRSPDFMKSHSVVVPSKLQSVQKSQSLSLPSTHQHSSVPVVTMGLPQAPRSQSVSVPSTHQHSAVPVVDDMMTREELSQMRSELTAARAAEMKSLFLRQDLQDQLLQLRKELDFSRQAALDMEWTCNVQDEASVELHRRQERQQQELKAALEEANELRVLKEKQVYLEDDVLGMSVQLDTMRSRERLLHGEMRAAVGEAERLLKDRVEQEQLQEDVAKANAEIHALKHREQQLLSTMGEQEQRLQAVQEQDLRLRAGHEEDANLQQGEVMLLRQQLHEANSKAEQGMFLQDVVVGVSTQLEASRLQEAQLQEQLSRALAEIQNLRNKQEWQLHLEEEVLGLSTKVDTLNQQEKDRQEELVRVRSDLLNAEHAKEELRQVLEDRLRRPEDEIRSLASGLEAVQGRDRQSREQLQRSRAQLDEVAEAAQARQRCLQDMLRRSHSEFDEMRAKEAISDHPDGGLRQEVNAMAAELNALGCRDLQQREDLGRARVELEELQEQERRRCEELLRLQEDLNASSEAQAQQQALLLRARFDAEEARADQRRQQHRLEDEVCRTRRPGWSTASQAETATTCSSECSKDAEEGGIQATVEALHGCEKQRQELQGQATREAAELSAFRARELQREEKLQALRKETDASREALRDMQAKLTKTENAKEKMRTVLHAELSSAHSELRAYGARQPGMKDARLSDGSECACLKRELEEALHAKEQLRQDLEEVVRTKEDLQGELLRACTQLSAEAVEKNRATAILRGELAAARAELAEARSGQEGPEQALTQLSAADSPAGGTPEEAAAVEVRVLTQQDVQDEVSSVKSESHKAARAEKTLRQRTFEELSALKVSLQQAALRQRQ